jgi:hypothetical protein
MSRLNAPTHMTYFGEGAYLLSRIWANFMLVRIMLLGTDLLFESWCKTYSQMYDKNLSKARNDRPSGPTCWVYLGNLGYSPFAQVSCNPVKLCGYLCTTRLNTEQFCVRANNDYVLVGY